MLLLPICTQTRVILHQPHYPENLGAIARAMKTMGLTRLVTVGASRLAVPEHPMAFKMAVKSWDVLDAAVRYPDLESALEGVDLLVTTSGRKGIPGICSPREAAQEALKVSSSGGQIAILMGNEKTGLPSEIIDRAHLKIRIPMADLQPSINLAQAVQIICYEWFTAGLSSRADT